MTAPSTMRLPVRVPGRALAAVLLGRPEADLTAAEVVAVLEDFCGAPRCGGCGGIMLGARGAVKR